MIPKSRYDSVDLYLSEDWINRPEYNDSNAPIDESIYQRLRDHGKISYTSSLRKFVDIVVFTGLDDLLSKHIAHLFIRDPIVIFSELLDQDDEVSVDHFEVCQSYHPYRNLP